ncbi:MAG: hypothetical protein FJX92_01595 [Bacteroidetes bacterium]|nr:hypothetical protein [Bacteroidota bacterium]
MLSTSECRSQLDRFLCALPVALRKDLTIEYAHCSTLHGVINVVIARGDQCMALGRFRAVSEKEPSAFVNRFRMAMGYPADTWYLFDFDGERMVINDLSLTDPLDVFTDSARAGFRRLCTLPSEWKEEQKTLNDMKQFLEAMRYLIDEEAIHQTIK